MSNKALRKVIEDYIEAFNTFNVDKMVQQFAEDGKFEVILNLTQPWCAKVKSKSKHWPKIA